ncbi:MAG TPA: RNA polymerase sigma factor [Mycobacteriales bacterium]|nr:RNA polymerase sigma factor [Mycobacteriales bacterium]
MTGDADDTGFVPGVLDGDQDAFGSLFDAHADAVHRYCARRCGDPGEAEDLTSVVFLEAWRTRTRAVVVDGSLRPWLFGIARNVVRNANRSRRRYRAALERLHALPLPADGDEGHGVAAAAELRSALTEAIHRLSDKQRDVVELCLVEQLSPAAAAAVLGIPEGTVKSRLADARARLRALLRPGELAELTDPGGLSGHQPGERQEGAPARRAAASWTQ